MQYYNPSPFGTFLSLFFRRPKRLQIAALCHRYRGNAKEFLLITSRDTGRWIIPKGWPIRGLSSRETALREAWEEAGVKNSKASDHSIGAFCYDKRRDNGLSVPVETLVYSVSVKEIADDFPEVDERVRKWVSAEDAADMVQEPELKAILRDQ
ncbi:MAG: NUDIX hydrolase [Pelagimonas sp.]|uniref:NUDIX hydrolase n=1 Tax=Pelagimonas sp. TaxID=2073170 RepID=UPI003D6ACBCD